MCSPSPAPWARGPPWPAGPAPPAPPGAFPWQTGLDNSFLVIIKGRWRRQNQEADGGGKIRRRNQEAGGGGTCGRRRRRTPVPSLGRWRAPGWRRTLARRPRRWWPEGAGEGASGVAGEVEVEVGVEVQVEVGVEVGPARARRRPRCPGAPARRRIGSWVEIRSSNTLYTRLLIRKLIKIKMLNTQGRGPRNNYLYPQVATFLQFNRIEYKT